MSVNRTRDWARGLKGLTKSERILIVELAEYNHSGTNVVWPSQERLSSDTEIPLRTLQRALASLETKGLIERTKGNQHQGTIFTLNVGSEPAILNSEPAKVNTPKQTRSQERTRQNVQVNPPFWTLL